MADVILIPCDTAPYHSPISVLKKVIATYVSSWDILNQPVAIKTHFGEEGAVRFIRPIYVKPAADVIKEFQGLPFVTDTNTLYKSPRALSPSHLQLALQHGFSYATLNCPVIIADGLRGNNEVKVIIEGKSFFLARDFVDTQFHIVLTHITFHGFTGVAGALKNIGMGYASKKGKTAIHKATVPQMTTDLCTACGECQERCYFNALSLSNNKIILDKGKCTGCCHCMGVCLQNVFDIKETALIKFCKLLGEYAKAAIREKKFIFVNFLIDITQQCDCASFTHKPACRDIGILVSDDILKVEGATIKMLQDHGSLEKERLQLWKAQLSAFSQDLNYIDNIKIDKRKK